MWVYHLVLLPTTLAEGSHVLVRAERAAEGRLHAHHDTRDFVAAFGLRIAERLGYGTHRVLGYSSAPLLLFVDFIFACE